MTSPPEHPVSRAAASAPPLRLAPPAPPAAALGLAVSHLMTKPAFAALRFGAWSRVLVGQINRGHHLLVLRGERVVGFAGWALTDAGKAEGWVTGTRELASDEGREGDHVVFNAWSADDPEVHRFLLDRVRRVVAGRQLILFKRYYPDGRVRPVRLSVNAFVDGHLARADGERGEPPEGSILPSLKLGRIALRTVRA